MEWPQFFSSLENFLPKKVPMLPSLQAGFISFSVVIALGAIFYYSRMYKDKPKESIYKQRFGIFLYVMLLISLAAFSAKLSFTSKFYSDNLNTNGRWMVYKTWGMADKLPIF